MSKRPKPASNIETSRALITQGIALIITMRLQINQIESILADANYRLSQGSAHEDHSDQTEH